MDNALAFSAVHRRQRHMVHDRETFIDVRRRSPRSVSTRTILVDAIILLSGVVLLDVTILIWAPIDLNVMLDMKIFVSKTAFVNRGGVGAKILRRDGQGRVVSTLADQVSFDRLYTCGQLDSKI